MKPWKVLAATAAMGALLATPAMADVSTEIYYNGNQLNTTQPVVNVGGRVMLAMRDLFESLEGDVYWDEQARMASVTYGRNNIKLFPDSGAVLVNGVPQELVIRPQIIQDRVYLPLRFVSQSLGSTVDYHKEAGDIGVVNIRSIDSVQNFAQKQGDVTQILRKTDDPVCRIAPNKDTQAAYDLWKAHNRVHFVDDHDNLVEVQSYDRTIAVHITDSKAATVTTQTYQTDVLYPALTSVTRVGTKYEIGINETGSTRYVGVGTPISNRYDWVIESKLADYMVHEGRAQGTVFRFDAVTDQGTVTKSGATGKVLDLAQSLEANASTGYAVADNGNYAFLMDGHLLILQDNNTVLEDVVLSYTAKDSRVFAMGNRFVVIAVESSLNHPEVYAAVYNSDGSAVAGFHNISHLSQVEKDEYFYDYHNLQIRDAAVSNGIAYMLLKTDMDYYLVRYELGTGASYKERFTLRDHSYTALIPTMEGVLLYGDDTSYYYLRDLK